MPAPKEILDLVARFELHLDAYKSGQYNETQLRRDFLDPFFKALGWDIDNSSGHAEAYRDVIHEDAVRIGDAVKAPDYSFRVGGQRKFFLEAKKPSVHIKEDIAPAFQLRRYAWSAKLPLSVLSDFEEFAIYDCRLKPDRTDKASIARVFYCGESVLLPAYRGRGIGHAFFDHREAHARACVGPAGGYTHSAFCGVVRPDDHPARPADYVPVDAFWRKRGYLAVPGLMGAYSWQDLGASAPTEHPMQFWVKAL